MSLTVMKFDEKGKEKKKCKEQETTYKYLV